MIRITEIRLRPGHSRDELEQKILHMLRIKPEELKEWKIIRQSIDARKRPEIFYTYTVDVRAERESRILSRIHDRRIRRAEEVSYHFPDRTEGSPAMPQPVIVGAGPAGLFCAWKLAEHGFRPVLLEQGETVEKRHVSVERFWSTGELNPISNVQFGEGGAGTFSDGKLNTAVRDKSGRNREVLSMFVRAGAPEEILYQARPHLGTDLLTEIVRNIRRQILNAGGEIHFETKVTDLLIRDGRICGVRTAGGEEIAAPVLILAIGHSARDTFFMLQERGLRMEAKPFAVGVRVQHPQRMINLRNYGMEDPGSIGPADYKLTGHLKNGRSVYSFCMCPGGYVVNASSEPGLLAVNGMSYRDRNSENANSAIVVSVQPEDFSRYGKEGIPELFNGLLFQRELEKKAFAEGAGRIPVQRLEDFARNRAGTLEGSIHPCFRGAIRAGNVRRIFPEELASSILDGMRLFERKIPGFSDPDTLMAGVESRTSSPVRILRDEHLESSISGIIPCGEGAGYAGGITSAAMDGLRAAEAAAVFCGGIVN